MPYLITDFEGVPLPPAMTDDDLGVGKTDASLLDSIGGVFDYWQGATRYPRKRTFRHKGKYEAHSGLDLVRITTDGDLRVTTTGEVRVTALSAAHDLQAKVDFLKARIGERGKLWRKRITDGVRTWKQCRLLDVRHIAKVDDAQAIAEIETDWETADVGWRSAAPSIASGSGAIVSLSVANAGTVPVDDAILTVARSSGTITLVDIYGRGIALRWIGTLGSGQALTIDCAAQTVRINGVNAYGGFALLPAHSVNGWLPLRTGMTALTIAVTGGNVDATMEHYNQWA